MNTVNTKIKERKIDDIIKVIGDQKFTVFGGFYPHTNDIRLSFVVGSIVYEIQVFPKCFSFTESHMFDWNEDKRKFETMQTHQFETVDNRKGLKKFKEWIQSLIDNMNTTIDFYDGRCLFITEK